MSSSFSFEPDWQEHLLCRTPWTTFAVEITMDDRHVYFPDEARWIGTFPPHLHQQWREVVNELQEWCELEGVPLSLCSDAWIELQDREIA